MLKWNFKKTFVLMRYVFQHSILILISILMHILMTIMFWWCVMFLIFKYNETCGNMMRFIVIIASAVKEIYFFTAGSDAHTDTRPLVETRGTTGIAGQGC